MEKLLFWNKQIVWVDYEYSHDGQIETNTRTTIN